MAVKNQRARLVVEIVELRHAGGATWRVLCSIPGRESVFTRDFGAPGQVLDTTAFTQLLEWLEVTVSNLLLLTDGVQDSLL